MPSCLALPRCEHFQLRLTLTLPLSPFANLSSVCPHFSLWVSLFLLVCLLFSTSFFWLCLYPFLPLSVGLFSSCLCVSLFASVSFSLSIPTSVSPSPQPLGPCRCEPGFLGRACDLHLWENQGAGWWHNVSAGDPAFSARVGAAGAFLSPPGLLAVFGGEHMWCVSGDCRPDSLWPGLETVYLPQARISTAPWVTSCCTTSLPTPGSAGT